MSSLSVSGGQSNTRRSTCEPTPASPRPVPRSGDNSASTIVDAYTHRLTGKLLIRRTSIRCHQSRSQRNQSGNPLKIPRNLFRQTEPPLSCGRFSMSNRWPESSHGSLKPSPSANTSRSSMSTTPILKPEQDEGCETSVQTPDQSTWNVEEPIFERNSYALLNARRHQFSCFICFNDKLLKFLRRTYGMNRFAHMRRTIEAIDYIKPVHIIGNHWD